MVITQQSQAREKEKSFQLDPKTKNLPSRANRKPSTHQEQDLKSVEKNIIWCKKKYLNHQVLSSPSPIIKNTGFAPHTK